MFGTLSFCAALLAIASSATIGEDAKTVLRGQVETMEAMQESVCRGETDQITAAIRHRHDRRQSCQHELRNLAASLESKARSRAQLRGLVSDCEITELIHANSGGQNSGVTMGVRDTFHNCLEQTAIQKQRSNLLGLEAMGCEWMVANLRSEDDRLTEELNLASRQQEECVTRRYRDD